MDVELVVEQYQICKEQGALSFLGMSYAKFTIAVRYTSSTDTFSWRIYKRYSEIEGYHEIISDLFKPIALHSSDVIYDNVIVDIPTFPEKRRINSLDTDFLQSRIKELNIYFKELFKSKEIAFCQASATFLNIHHNIQCISSFGWFDPGPPTTKSSKPHALMDTIDPIFGTAKSHAVIPRESTNGEIYIVQSAVEQNIIAKVDIKLINVQLPWEPEHLQIPLSHVSLWRYRGLDAELIWCSQNHTAVTTSIIIERNSPLPSQLAGLQESEFLSTSIIASGFESGKVLIYGTGLTKQNFPNRYMSLGQLQSGFQLSGRFTSSVIELGYDKKTSSLIGVDQKGVLRAWNLDTACLIGEFVLPLPTGMIPEYLVRFAVIQSPSILLGLTNGDVFLLAYSGQFHITKFRIISQFTSLNGIGSCRTALLTPSSEGSAVLAHSANRFLHIWFQDGPPRIGDFPSFVLHARIAAGDKIISLAAPSRQNLLTLGLASGVIEIRDFQGSLCGLFVAHEWEVSTLCAISKGDQYFLNSGSSDRHLKLWKFHFHPQEIIEKHNTNIISDPWNSAVDQSELSSRDVSFSVGSVAAMQTVNNTISAITDTAGMIASKSEGIVDVSSWKLSSFGFSKYNEKESSNAKDQEKSEIAVYDNNYKLASNVREATEYTTCSINKDLETEGKMEKTDNGDIEAKTDKTDVPIQCNPELVSRVPVSTIKSYTDLLDWSLN